MQQAQGSYLEVELGDGLVQDVIKELRKRWCNGRCVNGRVHELQAIVVLAHRLQKKVEKDINCAQSSVLAGN